ncbi:hypothetical protein [Carnobacterium sp. TMP28]|uniref:hypothetical protein n=1 Tax=Carnobacterium sp. TMP28 TaxID=3397060 RepID=UPI0039E02675
MKKRYIIILSILIIILLVGVIVNRNSLSSFLSKQIDTLEKSKKINVLNRDVHKHLTIYYPDSDKNLIPLTKRILDLAINKNKDLFKTSYTIPYDIIIFENKKEIESFSGLDYAIGFNNPEINTIGILPENREALLKDIPPIIWNYQRNLLHEYTHYTLSQKLIELDLSETDIPFWFKEGISEYIGFNNIIIGTMESPVIPLTDLFTSEQWSIYRTNPKFDVYLQSYLSINFLITEYGVEVINEILIETKKEKNFEKGLFNSTNLSSSELENSI